MKTANNASLVMRSADIVIITIKIWLVNIMRQSNHYL